MQVELVRVTASDGVRLDGAIWSARGRSAEGAVDGVMCLHGVGGNFYGSRLFDALTSKLQERGQMVLRINTRGHDGVSTASTPQGGRLQGAAYERVADCCLDVTAWIECLVERGCRRIALVGHSLGALKALFAQAHAAHPAVARIVAISPPRLSYARFVRGSEADKFQASLTTAEHWMSEGRPDMLFQATFPFPLVLSAATFLDKYGPEERYNFLRFSERLATPTCFVYGGEELAAGSSSFEHITEEIHAATWGSDGPTVRIIPDANHFYVGRIAALEQVVLEACA